MTEATDAAIPIEVRKIAYRQSAKEGFLLTLSLHPDDVPQELAAAPIGTRYMAALVQIGDDEKPAKRKRNWEELPPASQAGIRCGEEAFQKYLGTSNEDEATQYVYTHCGIQSRVELSTNADAAAKWRALDSEYRHGPDYDA